MSINVKHPEVEHLVDELKRRTGMDTMDLLLDLLQREHARLDAGAEDRIAKARADTQALVERWNSLPLIDPRPIDEIVAYDENGLPV